MGIKKSYKKLAMASACALAVGWAVSAQALIKMTDAIEDGVTVATEIAVDGTNGTNIANTGNIFDVTSAIGFGQAIGATYYVRYDLDNSAEFKANPTSVICDGDAGVLSKGGIGESYAIYGITVAADTHASDEFCLMVNPAPADGITVYNQNTVTVSYSMYSTPGDAVGQTNALATDSEAMISWGSALDADFDAVNPDEIDVTNQSVQFDDDDGLGILKTIIADVNIDVDGTTLWTDGAPAAMADLVADGTALVITGDFTGTQDLTSGVPDGTYDGTGKVFIDNDGGCDNVHTDATVTSTAATITLDQIGVLDAAVICIAVNGVSTLAGGSYTGLYDVTVPATSDLADQILGTSSNPLSTIAKNGSSSRLTFALTPNGTYVNYLRITNPSTMAGNVYLTLINDDGDSVPINLGDIAGVSSSSLAAGASTALININDVYAAAQVEDPAFDHNSGKLRVLAEGEFGTTGATTGIVMNSFSMTTDGTGFFMMTDASN